MSSQPLSHIATNDEFREGRSWWKVCCAGCCLGIVALVVVVPFGFRFVAGSGPRSVQRLPDTYPSALVFRPEQASEILYYSGESKGTVSSLVRKALDGVMRLTGSSSSTGAVNAIGTQLQRIEGRDTVSVHWSNLRNVSREEVLRFYTGALRELGVYSVKTTDRPYETEEVHLTGSNTNVALDLILLDDPKVAGIDSLTVVADYAIPESSTAR